MPSGIEIGGWGGLLVFFMGGVFKEKGQQGRGALQLCSAVDIIQVASL